MTIAPYTSTNWSALSEAQKDYFRHLASDSELTPMEFFEETVPPELQAFPGKIEVFINGGTVVTEEWDYSRGRGGEYVQVEHEVSDKDWSHDTSVANGGSDEPTNGRWENSSTNRARGSRNSTEAEQANADAQADADVDVLERGTIIEEAEEAATITAGVEAAELAAGVLEIGMDFLAPVVGGAMAAKLASDHVDDEHKVAAGAAAGFGTAAILCTPVGQAGLGLYLGYKLIRRGHKFISKRMA